MAVTTRGFCKGRNDRCKGGGGKDTGKGCEKGNV
ncbi:hypothetical protein BH20ACT15_BH20ACT15_10480 [soil metagenome]